ncbi:glycosyltransferase family 4 protein [Wenyingzhuangia marina]|uniref:Glycosyltransferase involved in cell wall bisynthesis n=1 Tax=Wenyingzhuangia marina TaxID=1195760 RepID=A0A1M5U9H4_9FLAO|nr:glycosyltransferase family 4 protein [Wenyingzhuangia marina]GGF68857.1 glycoside hydrolase [Wenyingzhuangia marina]SHH59644.1 Glycosyltransferase involved in cell wall bisynthesis [Wenyingzhuangia marina]
MNIAFITPEYPLEVFKGNIGGIGTFTKSLAEHLVRFSYEVTVFVHSQPKEQVLVENGVEIHLVKKKAIKGITWYTNRRYFNQYVNTIISDKNIEVIEAPEWTGFTAFMKFSCPLVIRLHGSDTYFCDLENRKVKAKNKFFEKKAITGANKIVGVSDFVTQKTKQLFNLHSDIEVFYNAIDSSLFKPNHQEIKPKTLLYFGTIIRKKGVLSIAKAFNEIVKQDPKVKLCLLGRDNRDVFTRKSTLEMFKELLSKKAKKQFTYVAEVPYEEVIKYIQQADVVLLPSFAEAFPMTWLEAMALEKKLVTSNIGWAKELMVDNETGFTVNPENIKEFSIKVLTLLNDEGKAIQMAINARQRIVNKFDVKQSIKKNIAMYKSIIK